MKYTLNYIRLRKGPGRPKKFRAWPPVLILLALTIATFFIGKYKTDVVRAQTKENTAYEILHSKDSKVQELLKENTGLKEKLEAQVADAAPAEIKNLSRFYIRKYFGAEAPTAERVFTCESGLLNTRIHINKPGLGEDKGIAQINAIWHAKRFKEVTGVDFNTGVYDFDANIHYAKWLRDHSGWNQWTCAKIVKL